MTDFPSRPDTPRNRGDHDAPHVSPVTPAEDARSVLLNRVSWGAVLAGVVVALVAQLILNMIGIGIGAATLDPSGTADQNPSARGFSIGAAVWWTVSGIVAALSSGALQNDIAGVAEKRAKGIATGRVELTGVGCNEATVPRLFPEWLKEKRLAPLFWWDAPPEPEYLAQMGAPKKIPNLLELSGVNFPRDTKTVVNLALQIFAFTRALVLPPKVPDDIYQAWVRSYEAASKDPEMLEVANKGGHELRLGRP